MGRRLRMTAALGDWLTELSASEPATAAEVGARLVAVLSAAEPAGLFPAEDGSIRRRAGVLAGTVNER